MQLYNCKVRLGGSVINEVRKSEVTAPEILILREMHGSDAVVDIVKTEMDRRSNEDERARLNAKYASPAKTNAETHKRRVEMMRALFGHDAMALPTKLPNDAELPQFVDPRPVRTVLKKTEQAEMFA